MTKSLDDIFAKIAIDLGRLPSPSIGMRTGFPALDDMIGADHWKDGELIGLAARPGMGKTAWALDVALHAAKTSGKDVFIFSFDLLKRQVVERLLAKLAGLPLSVFSRSGNRITDETWCRIQEAFNELRKWKIHINDTAALSPSYIADQLKAVDTPGLVIIDDLEQMTNTTSFKKMQQAATQIIRQLHTIAHSRHVSILCCCGLPRYQPPREPTLTDLRRWLPLEQEADMILMLHRNSYYTNAPASKQDQADLIVCKNRHGPIGKIPLMFDKAACSFHSI